MAELPAALRSAGVTPREAEVLRALAARLTNAEIAEDLVVSIRTVESHVSSLLRKLGEPDRRALAARAQGVARDARAPLPAPLVDAVRQPMVGRDAEISRLLAQAARVEERGVRCLVVVRGDAGIGKTRLAAELAARLHADGAVVRHGRCQQDALVPYQGLREALDDGAAERLDAESATPTESGDRHQLFETFDGLLVEGPAPVVVVVDDIHWMDPSGLQLLRHLMNNRGRSAALVVATARPEGTAPGHPFASVLSESVSAGAADVLDLGALSLEDATVLAADLGSSDVEWAERAWRRADGNPFLMTELLRGDQAEGRLPSAARDPIVQRITGLGSSVFEILSAAAVLGDRSDLDTVAAMSSSPVEAVEEAFESAFRAGLVVNDGTSRADYRFTHSIVREALVDAASAASRSRHHLAAAVALESGRRDAAPEVARHRHAALPRGDPAAARRTALKAYEHAIDRFAFEVAASFADMALDAVDAGGGSAEDRAQAVLLRGRAKVRSGDLNGIDDCRQALEVANRLGIARMRALATLAWAEAVPIWARNDLLRAALSVVLDDTELDLALRAQVKARLAQVSYYEESAAERARLSREAVADARADGRPETLASVLTVTHAIVSDPTALGERTEIARQMVAGAVAAGDPLLEAKGLGWLAVDLLELGDRMGAEAAFSRHRALAARLGSRVHLRDADAWDAMRAVLAGRYDEATLLAERARDRGIAAHDPSADTIYWVQRYWCALESGRREEMDDIVVPCERIADQNRDVPAWRAALCLLHVRRGDVDAAAEQYSHPLLDDLESIRRDVVWLNAMTYLAETAWFLRDRDRAADLFELLSPFAERVVLIDRGFACRGSVHRFLGLLGATMGDRDLAEHHLGLARERHAALSAGPLVARVTRELTSVQGDPSTR